MKLRHLIPPGERWWKSLDATTVRGDLIAGLLGALLVLPQGVAFARLAGLPPAYGIYSAILPCIAAALFGSSRHVVSGPTNANSLALFAMLSPLAAPGSPEYLQLVFTATFMVGLMQLLVALFRLGVLANFIAPSVLLGFTSGAACLIAYHAGIDLRDLVWPEEGALAPLELVVAAVTVIVTVLVARFFPRWPAMLTGLASGFAAAAASAALGGPGYVQMGAIPSIIPPLSLPDFDLEKLSQVVGLSLALAVVALGQSISIAKAIADRSGQHIDANREFFGQGLANVAASFSSSYLSCGSLNRSMPNFEAGARTPLAAVASALILLVLVALSERLLERLPMATIAALLLYVAWTLINIPRIRETLQFNMQEAACMVVTWGAVLVTRIELAILIGMGLSLIFYLYQTSRPAMRVLVPVPQGRRFTPLTELDQVEPECPQLKLVRMEGSVYFGASQQVSDTLRRYRECLPKQKHLLVMVKSMNFIDQAGARVWEQEDDVRRKMGGALYFHRPRARVVAVWERTGFLERLGKDRVFDSKHDALASIVPSLDPQICARCTARTFLECPGEGAPCVQPRCG